MIPRRKIDGIWRFGSLGRWGDSNPASQVMTLIDNKALPHPNWRTEAPSHEPHEICPSDPPLSLFCGDLTAKLIM